MTSLVLYVCRERAIVSCTCLYRGRTQDLWLYVHVSREGEPLLVVHVFREGEL